MFKVNIKEFSSGEYKPWKRLGVLEGLEDDEGHELAKLMGKGFKFLHDKKIMVDGNLSPETDGVTSIVLMMFPVLRRVYSKTHNPNIDVKEIYYNFIKFYHKNLDKYLELNKTGIDGEAEMCADFSDFMIIKINENE